MDAQSEGERIGHCNRAKNVSSPCLMIKRCVSLFTLTELLLMHDCTHSKHFLFPDTLKGKKTVRLAIHDKHFSENSG